MVKTLIAANWKMYKLPSEASQWAKDFVAKVPDSAHCDVAICAPATHLSSLAAVLKASPVNLGAQDVSAHAQGAYTGEIAAEMLKDLGVKYVIVGHSERREYHQESDALVRAKLLAVQAQGMLPILCIGESLAQREAGEAVKVTLAQLSAALEGVKLNPQELVIAYEPIWAIGTGKTATSADAEASVLPFAKSLTGFMVLMRCRCSMAVA
ncbi:MAG: triose-phosphate isomerase [Deinococcales bacterium]